MKKILFITMTVVILSGCDNPIEKASNLFAGVIQDSLSQNMNNGKSDDKVKKMQLEIIKKGVNDLQIMGDPNINEVINLIEKHLADNKLSNYENNEITMLINKHKRELNLKKSKHSDDVKAFKESIYQSQ
ncbi:hypothetical protein ACRJAL_003618 [Acinetobacter baumannii]|nr:hypothetical protein [Acinetobacter baumannii]